jgi:hypothetical protein
MVNFLSRLVERTLGNISTVKPLIAPRFAPGLTMLGDDRLNPQEFDHSNSGELESQDDLVGILSISPQETLSPFTPFNLSTITPHSPDSEETQGVGCGGASCVGGSPDLSKLALLGVGGESKQLFLQESINQGAMPEVGNSHLHSAPDSQGSPGYLLNVVNNTSIASPQLPLVRSPLPPIQPVIQRSPDNTGQMQPQVEAANREQHLDDLPLERRYSNPKNPVSLSLLNGKSLFSATETGFFSPTSEYCTDALEVYRINFDSLRSSETRFLQETGFLGTRRNQCGKPLVSQPIPPDDRSISQINDFGIAASTTPTIQPTPTSESRSKQAFQSVSEPSAAKSVPIRLPLVSLSGLSSKSVVPIQRSLDTASVPTSTQPALNKAWGQDESPTIAQTSVQMSSGSAASQPIEQQSTSKPDFSSRQLSRIGSSFLETAASSIRPALSQGMPSPLLPVSISPMATLSQFKWTSGNHIIRPVAQGDAANTDRVYPPSVPETMVLRPNQAGQPRVEFGYRRGVTITELQQSPTVQVTIGRIDVRGVKPAPPPRSKPTQRGPTLSLNDYLKQRNGGSP